MRVQDRLGKQKQLEAQGLIVKYVYEESKDMVSGKPCLRTTAIVFDPKIKQAKIGWTSLAATHMREFNKNIARAVSLGRALGNAIVVSEEGIKQQTREEGWVKEIRWLIEHT